jgi:hypothetical protein
MTHQTVTSEFPTGSTVIIVAPHGTRGSYAARIEGRDDVLCVSKAPFLTSARKLLELGYDPSTILVMGHVGSPTECLRGRIGAAAELIVHETPWGPVFQKASPTLLFEACTRPRRRSSGHERPRHPAAAGTAHAARRIGGHHDH